MREIKRVLWVDDRPENEVNSLFIDAETKQVRLMVDAVKEISSSHLYDYDTIVFDIDFENGSLELNEVIEELDKKIHLDPDQKQDNDFIINNGGYLLFIYLLERGYPSKQVAFLTGNPGMLEKLRDYNRKDVAMLSKEEIAAAYKDAWDDAGDDDDAWDNFIHTIESLPVAYEYITEKVILDCSDYLEHDEYDELKKYINSISPKPVTGEVVQNTGDLMIYRFHEANIEPPEFFTKKEYYIKGHDKGDAKEWLAKNRTKDRLTRWLILSAGYHVKTLFDKNSSEMKNQMARLFRDANTDPGVWTSFSQLYNLFYGLRDIDQKEPYYQAISAMLIPFDKNPYSCGDYVSSAGTTYDRIQKSFASFSKQTRNYCAHNLFGSSVSNYTALFIIMGTLTAVLNYNQRSDFDDWFEDVYSQIGTNNGNDIRGNIEKIDALGNRLFSNGDINLDTLEKNRLPSSYEACNPWKLLRALGYNSKMDIEHEQSTTVRENYFVFTLAVYIVKWFDGLTEQEVNAQFGRGIEIVYRLANEIVAAYVYPH